MHDQIDDLAAKLRLLPAGRRAQLISHFTDIMNAAEIIDGASEEGSHSTIFSISLGAAHYTGEREWS